MRGIGYVQSAPDEGSVSAERNPSPDFDASASKSPSPTRGEGNSEQARKETHHVAGPSIDRSLQDRIPDRAGADGRRDGCRPGDRGGAGRSEEHTSELQSPDHL